MSSLQVSVACYKFEDLVDDGFQLDIADGQGTTWRLILYVYPDTDNVSGSFSLSPKEKNRTLVQGLKYQLRLAKAVLVSAEVLLVVRDQSGKVVHEHNIPMTTYRCQRNNAENSVVEFNFAKVSVLKEMLVDDDALIIDAIIQYDQGRLHVPKNPFNQNMLNLLDSEEDKDVFFNVEGRIMSAHKLILKANSSVLATLCIGESRKSLLFTFRIQSQKFSDLSYYSYMGGMYQGMLI